MGTTMHLPDVKMYMFARLYPDIMYVQGATQEQPSAYIPKPQLKHPHPRSYIHAWYTNQTISTKAIDIILFWRIS